MIERDLVIVGDEAFDAEEWARLQRRRAIDREYDREHREERTAYHREWRERNREHVREYNREWMMRNRPKVLRSKRESAKRQHRYLVGSLHGLACTGPTRATGCVCVKIRCYDKPAVAPTVVGDER